MRGQMPVFNYTSNRAAFGMYTSPRLKRDELSTTAGIAHGAKAIFQLSHLDYVSSKEHPISCVNQSAL